MEPDYGPVFTGKKRPGFAPDVDEVIREVLTTFRLLGGRDRAPVEKPADRSRGSDNHPSDGGLLLPWFVACSNACASCSTLHSSRCRPTICNPTGSPLAVNPPGTEIAGFDMNVTYQHDRIQSM